MAHPGVKHERPTEAMLSPGWAATRSAVMISAA